MKLNFKLYSQNKTKYSSSIFDLISGDNETKQTKGLAYLLSANANALIAFLSLHGIKQSIENKLKRNYSHKYIVAVEVSAERFTTSGKRVDIIINIEMSNDKKIALIIEAKNLKITHNQESINTQIKNYLDDKELPDLKTHEKIGITLTKHKNFEKDTISITWDEIISFLSHLKVDRNSLPKQFLNFLIKTNKEMKYYEAEVLSIAAGDTIDFINRHLVYECPDSKNYSYAQKPIFLAFRYKDGTMKKLYKLEDIVSLDISSKAELDNFINSDFDENQKMRILSYIEDRENASVPKKGFIRDKKRFYILSTEESSIIDLTYSPKPEKNNTKHRYYSLKELLTSSVLKKKG